MSFDSFQQQRVNDYPLATTRLRYTPSRSLTCGNEAIYLCHESS